MVVGVKELGDLEGVGRGLVVLFCKCFMASS